MATQNAIRSLAANRALVRLACALGVALAALYLSQHLRVSPHPTDEGVLLTFIDQVAHGERPHRDFIDAYGPLNAMLPAPAYFLSGNRILGVRIWLVLVKLLSVVLTFMLVRRLADAFHGFWAALLTAGFLGLPWPYMVAPYAFHHAYPLTLLTCFLLFCRPFAKPIPNLVAAAFVTSIVLLLKINAGCFLLAGGILALLGWAPQPSGTAPPDPRESQPGARRAFRMLQIAALACFVGVFLIFIRQYFNWQYLLYLVVPIGLAACAYVLRVRADIRDGTAWMPQLRSAFVYGFSSIGITLLAGLLAFGPAGLIDYAETLIRILTHIDYVNPFPELGAPGPHLRYNDYYWTQLPWLATAIYAGCLAVRGVQSRTSPHAAGLNALWIPYTAGLFIIYARSDGAHLVQLVIASIPILFIGLAQLMGGASPNLTRGLVGAASLLAATSLWWGFEFPTLPAADDGWKAAAARGLAYRVPEPLALREGSSPFSNPDVDRALEDLVHYIDEITEDGEEILVTVPNEILPLLSNTRSYGGRYKYYFYLAKTDFLTPENFASLVPSELVTRLKMDPPRVMVVSLGQPTLYQLVPGFARLLRRNYRFDRRFAHFVVQLRKDVTLAPHESD